MSVRGDDASLHEMYLASDGYGGMGLTIAGENYVYCGRDETCRVLEQLCESAFA